MEDINDFTDYSLPVHRSLLKPDMLLGIGTNAGIMLLVVTIIFIQVIGFIFIFISAGIFLLLRLICKEDPYSLDILLNSILEQDIYYG